MFIKEKHWDGWSDFDGVSSGGIVLSGKKIVDGYNLRPVFYIWSAQPK